MHVRGADYASHKSSIDQAQSVWANVPLDQKRKFAKQFAHLVAQNSRRLHEAIGSRYRNSYAETVSAENLPLAAAAKWLSQTGWKLLRAKKLGRAGRPYWLAGVDTEVRRVPFGSVLIIGTWNYPIFLVGVQMLQAAFAGNAVVIKPAVQCEDVTALLVELMVQAGFPSELFLVLDSSVASAELAIQTGIDKVVMTGSVGSGKKVLTQLAQSVTPSVMELSGCDSMFVLEGADLDRVVSAILFGLRLNCGATCMAPRRIFVDHKIAPPLYQSLASRLIELPDLYIDPKAWQTISRIWQNNRRLI